MQTYPDPFTAHEPELIHGADVQGVVSQIAPLYPAGHAHEQVAGGPAFKTSTPPFKQVIASQGVTSQLVPE